MTLRTTKKAITGFVSPEIWQKFKTAAMMNKIGVSEALEKVISEYAKKELTGKVK